MRVWNRSGICPEEMAAFGPEVRSPEGLNIFGTPVGSVQFVQRLVGQRIQEEQKLREAISWVSDLQCAWQILWQCAGLRCHHFLRTLTPSKSMEYARQHDVGNVTTVEALLSGLTEDTDQNDTAWHIASLPMRLGGLGLRSAKRISPGAYWASWADALHMIQQRLPPVAEHVVGSLSEHAAEDCLRELQEAASELDRDGFVNRLSWSALQGGQHPPFGNSGEWQHGWQYHASSSFEHPCSLLLLTKPTSDRILVQVAVTCCLGAPQVWSSKCNFKISERWSWRDYASHSTSQKPDVHVEFACINVEDTVRVAQEVAGRGHGRHIGTSLPRRRGHSPSQHQTSRHECGGPRGR